jgi:cytochrome P450
MSQPDLILDIDMALYDPFSRDIHINPYPTYKILRDEHPLYHNPDIGFWALTRHQDVWDATLDWQRFSSSAGPALEVEISVPMMIAMDPPEHNRNRGIISKAFTPRAIEKLEPQIRQIINGYLDQLQEQNHFDVVEDFSAKFPMDVISTMLGIPQEDRDQIRQWSNIALSRKPGQKEPPEEAIMAGANNWFYFQKYLEQRRKNPQDDMMTVIAHAKGKDDDGIERGLTDNEILGFIALLVAAGNETLTKFFGNAIYHLARYPDARREIRNNKAIIPNAVEEILRFDPPSQYQGRIAMCDIEIYGQVIPKGDRVILVTGAACRDEREYPNPDTLDIHRKINRQLALGFGYHLCLGASLARLEGRIALEEFFKLFPDYQVDEQNVKHVHSSNVRGFSSVPIQVGKAIPL